MAEKKDLFSNRAIQGITMSGANAISFEQMRFGVGLFEGVGLVIHRIDYHLSLASVQELVADTDWITFGMSNRDDLTSVLPTSQNVIDCGMATCVIVGTVVGINHLEMPITHDYSNFPGGGLIVPANPIYLAMHSAGLTGAGVMRVTLHFTFKKLADKDYLELIQSLLPANI